MPTPHRAFIVMPFGSKPGPDGKHIDFDAIYRELLSPAVIDAGLVPHRADADRCGGSIHQDMFQDLLLAEFVIADLTLDNPNVWYEIGVRHALRAGGVALTYALRDRLPFDIAGQRSHRYTLASGMLDPCRLPDERSALTQMISETLGAWRGRRASPVYQQIPSLVEPDWRTLKIGNINEFWEALDRWQGRISVAKNKQRPGDILLLADETPNSILEFEALCTAAAALINLKRPLYALFLLEHARKLNPDDVRAAQLEGMALGRAGRYAEAREALKRLADRHKDGETLGLYARTWKDEWTRLWKAQPMAGTDALQAAKDTVATLEQAANAYADAFRSAPGDYFPGINALTLGRLWEHLTDRKSQIPLDLIAAGVRWSIHVALGNSRTYWTLVTLAELALIENDETAALDAYAAAAALALTERNGFALDSSRQQLAMLRALGYHVGLVQKAMDCIEQAEAKLPRLGEHFLLPVEPAHVVIFSGHMIDNPAVRGPGRTKPARFPSDKVDAVATEIGKTLDAIGVAEGDLAICGGAAGGDLLFAKACLERGMRLQIHLARVENEFLAESVTFHDPGHVWLKRFREVKQHANTTLLVLPTELGPAPRGTSVHDRCNRWMLYTALSQGLTRTSFVTVWDGKPGDGPGGTQGMIDQILKMTGEVPVIINPCDL